jgi:hypothetical protein
MTKLSVHAKNPVVQEQTSKGKKSDPERRPSRASKDKALNAKRKNSCLYSKLTNSFAVWRQDLSAKEQKKLEQEARSNNVIEHENASSNSSKHKSRCPFTRCCMLRH